MLDGGEVDVAAGPVVVDGCVLAGPGLVNVFAATKHMWLDNTVAKCE